MDTVREGEKGVTRKQRSKSIDHLNQSQVCLGFVLEDNIVVKGSGMKGSHNDFQSQPLTNVLAKRRKHI